MDAMELVNWKLSRVLLLAGLATACASPSGPSQAPAAGLPTLSAPAQGALIGALEQPVTLTVQNPPPSEGSSLKYTFEVALDAGFGTTVTTASVAEADGDRTSVTLGALPGGATYFWRVRSATATNTSLVTTSPASFAIGRDITSGPYEVIIDATGASCGGLFVQPLKIDGNVTRTANGFLFARPPNGCIISIHCGDRFTLNATLTRSAFTGSILVNGASLDVPSGYELTGDGEGYGVRGIVNADGTVQGTLRESGLGVNPNTSRLTLLAPNVGLSSKQQCVAPGYAWTLKPLPSK
jgi:hypothetical protein